MREEAFKVRALSGIHHVTAISGDAQRNADFYSGVLGLRLVKKTVNFDDPASYHLYYGDRVGTPGSIATFFVWPGASKGRIGAGEPAAMTFRIPPGALSYWKQRLKDAGATEQDEIVRGSEPVLRTTDSDGLSVELIEAALPPNSAAIRYWAGAGIPELYAIQGFHSVTLAHSSKSTSDDLFTSGLQFSGATHLDGRTRFQVGSEFIDVERTEQAGPGRMGAGTIHHIAFRVENDSEQVKWQQHVMSLGLQVSPVMDRTYFHSIYFREPGGVLFEVATDAPGFAIDEAEQTLGQALKLPSWYESLRGKLEARLPKFVVPSVAQ